MRMWSEKGILDGTETDNILAMDDCDIRKRDSTKAIREYYY